MKKTLLMLLFCSGAVMAQNTLSYTEIELHYNNGMELFEKKAYSAARREFRIYVQESEKSLNPNKFNIANAEYYSAVSALNSNSLDADIEVQRFVLHHGNHPKAKLIYSDLGNNFFEKGDYAKAIEYLQKAIEYREDDLSTLELRYKLGIAYYQQKNYKSALDEFNYVKQSAAESAIHAAYYAGVIHFQIEQYDLALDDLHRVENVNPYKVEVPNWIAQILYKQKKYDELKKYAEPVAANPHGRKIDEICLLLAEVYFFENNFTKAADYYMRYANLRKGKTDPQLSFRQGFSLYKTEQYDKVIAVMKRIADRPNTLGQQAAYYLGVSALQTKDMDAAVAAFDFARKTDFDAEIKEEASYNYSKVLVEQGNNEAAINALKEYVNSYTSGKYVDESNELLSEILFETKDYKRAISYIEGLKRKTTKIDAAYQKLCYSQGVNDFNAENLNEAIAYFDKALALPVNRELTQNALFWKAEASFAANKPNTEQLYREVLQKGNSQQHDKSLYSLGYLKFNNENWAGAQGYFKDFLRSSSANSSTQMREDAQLRLADCYLIQRQFASALAEYENALATNNSDKDYALYQKGVTLDLMGRSNEAGRVFNEFTLKYDNSRLIDDVLFKKGSLEMDKSNYQSAINTFTEMLRKRPKSKLVPHALLKRALANGNLENYDAAIADYKILINRFPQHETANEALIGLRDILNLTGRSEDFAEIANEYQENNPGSNSAIALQYDAAKNLFYTEKYAAAITALQKFIKANPNNANVSEAKFLIAESYYFTEQALRSLAYYKEVIEEGQSQYVNRAAFRAGDIEFKNGDYANSAKDYLQALNSSTSKRDQALAWEGLFKGYFLNGDYDNAIKYCKEAIGKAGGALPGIENRAELCIGKCYLKRKDFAQAKTQFDKVMAMGKDVNAAEAKYLSGEILYNTGKYDEVVKEMQDLAAKYSDFIEWYEKAFLLIADSYQGKKDYFMAKATLNSIIENSENSATVSTAKAKLKNIPQ